jgi:hypothetical protein
LGKVAKTGGVSTAKTAQLKLKEAKYEAASGKALYGKKHHARLTTIQMLVAGRFSLHDYHHNCRFSHTFTLLSSCLDEYLPV